MAYLFTTRSRKGWQETAGARQRRLKPRQKKKEIELCVLVLGEILEAKQCFLQECALSACCIIQTVPDMLVVFQPPTQWQHLSPLSSGESLLFRAMWLNVISFCVDGCHSGCIQCIYFESLLYTFLATGIGVLHSEAEALCTFLASVYQKNKMSVRCHVRYHHWIVKNSNL